jgi:hypothetical protein
MPASRRRSISPPTQLRKADLGTQEFRRAGSSVKAATLQIFRVFRAFRGQKKDSDCRSMEKINCFF